MSYASGGLIQATDFNGIANGTSGANIAWVWGTGYGSTGYGQSTTALASLSGGSVTTVSATQWSNMLSVLNAALGHQTGATYQLGPLNYTSGSTITYFANVTASAIGINQAANIAAFSSQGATTTGGGFAATINVGTATAYGPAYLATRSVTFTSGDAARYFFNAGGQLKLSMSHPTGTPLDSMFRLLCQQIGTLVISAPGLSPSTTHIAGVDYQGLTQVITQQGAVPDSFLAQAGYYGLTAASTEIFKQRMDTGFYSNYLGSSITVRANTNGTQGGNNDNGSSVTIEVIWSEIPPTLFVSVGTQIALTIVRPALSSDSGSSSPLVKAWGTYLVQASQSYI